MKNPNPYRCSLDLWSKLPPNLKDIPKKEDNSKLLKKNINEFSKISHLRQIM
jgi:hypothetical protein